MLGLKVLKVQLGLKPACAILRENITLRITLACQKFWGEKRIQPSKQWIWTMSDLGRNYHCKSSLRKEMLSWVNYLHPLLVSTGNKRNLIFTILLLQFRKVKSEKFWQSFYCMTPTGLLWISTLLFSGPRAKAEEISDSNLALPLQGSKKSG